MRKREKNTEGEDKIVDWLTHNTIKMLDLPFLIFD